MKVGDLVVFCGNAYFGVVLQVKHTHAPYYCLVHWFDDNYQSWEDSRKLREFT